MGILESLLKNFRGAKKTAYVDIRDLDEFIRELYSNLTFIERANAAPIHSPVYRGASRTILKIEPDEIFERIHLFVENDFVGNKIEHRVNSKLQVYYFKSLKDIPSTTRVGDRGYSGDYEGDDANGYFGKDGGIQNQLIICTCGVSAIQINIINDRSHYAHPEFYTRSLDIIAPITIPKNTDFIHHPIKDVLAHPEQYFFMYDKSSETKILVDMNSLGLLHAILEETGYTRIENKEQCGK